VSFDPTQCICVGDVRRLPAQKHKNYCILTETFRYSPLVLSTIVTVNATLNYAGLRSSDGPAIIHHTSKIRVPLVHSRSIGQIYRCVVNGMTWMITEWMTHFYQGKLCILTAKPVTQPWFLKQHGWAVGDGSCIYDSIRCAGKNRDSGKTTVRKK
jgi:hypothetical protein